MAKKTESLISHRDILTAIQRQEYVPIYLLMGEESYYIDRISEYIADNVLTEEEKGFNQQIIYCTRETNVADIINSAKRYPMMAKYQIVIVKEAQNLLKLDDLVFYAQNPLNTTILVICYKNGTVDKRKKLVPAISKVGIVYESRKLKESQLPAFVTDYLRRKNVGIDERSVLMLVEAIGSDLNRMAGELDKLVITLPAGFNRITPELIEKNIGISKDFNNLELRNAVINKDVFKANQIVNYFEQNSKANPAIVTLAMLFNFFANMMQAFYAPVKTEQGMCEYLDFKSSWQLRDYTTAMRHYSAMKTMRIIGKIRETDAKMKGIGKGNTTDGDLMRELIYFIMH
ncbi:MAG: DNA polymerase III subunit delta [Bacteroides sp.]|nr:DNA polymerase III subunit delta [Roseburia sp.]MCM1347684.1 DNA polymerase III subunit delta [Bacteroides sp.]MCM1420504.1 DNA polymerase III subunit delta [Bacteroides sp.]